ncbi:hypothetical protein FB451DRAFT_1167770 [Mycena latifolia]|nr:hypothetical protein FB451DRAFT_1167770 [Mycena latifolia]
MYWANECSKSAIKHSSGYLVLSMDKTATSDTSDTLQQHPFQKLVLYKELDTNSCQNSRGMEASDAAFNVLGSLPSSSTISPDGFTSEVTGISFIEHLTGHVGGL